MQTEAYNYKQFSSEWGTCNVTFNANGGTVSPTTRAVASGAAVGTLPTPTRSGYTFAGWYTAASGGTKIYASTTITANVTYYAHWTAKKYTVTFNANGGTVSPTTRTVTHGGAIGSLPTPTRSGYTFAGWYTTANGGTKISSSKMITANVTYYAHWTANGGGFSLSGTYQADKARTLSGAAFSGSEAVGVVSLKVGKANRAKTFRVSGTLTTLDGKKHTIKSTSATQGNGVLTISGVAVRDYGTMTLKLAANGFTATFSNGWTARTANVNSLPTGTLTFACAPYPGSVNGVPVKTEYLPLAQKVTSTGTKLTVPRAGRITYRNGSFMVNSGGENNPSGLKLTYTAKTGTLKGSFYFYTFNGKKLSKYTAKVTGVTVDGKGFANVTVNRITFSPPLKATLAP